MPMELNPVAVLVEEVLVVSVVKTARSLIQAVLSVVLDKGREPEMEVNVIRSI